MIFIDEINSSPHKKKSETNRIIHIQIDETWSIDLINMINYKVSNKKGFRYIFIIIDNFSKYV